MRIILLAMIIVSAAPGVEISLTALNDDGSLIPDTTVIIKDDSIVEMKAEVCGDMNCLKVTLTDTAGAMNHTFTSKHQGGMIQVAVDGIPMSTPRIATPSSKWMRIPSKLTLAELKKHEK